MKTSIILPTGSTVTSGDPVVELEHVSFDHGSERVLDEVSLRIGRGDFLGIIGPNGSGKTTLLKVLLGLLRPASGQITLFGAGQPPGVAAARRTHRRSRRGCAGAVLQSAAPVEPRVRDDAGAGVPRRQCRGGGGHPPGVPQPPAGVSRQPGGGHALRGTGSALPRGESGCCTPPLGNYVCLVY